MKNENYLQKKTLKQHWASNNHYMSFTPLSSEYGWNGSGCCNFLQRHYGGNLDPESSDILLDSYKKPGLFS